MKLLLIIIFLFILSGCLKIVIDVNEMPPAQKVEAGNE